MMANGRGMGPKIEFFTEVGLGSLKIEISIVENGGYKVYLTAKDLDDRRLWRTALTDADGNVKVYRSVSAAIKEAQNTLENSALI
jgi:hypothetical protein